MTTLHPLFKLRHPRRFWLSSLCIAIISAIVLAPWLDSSPWLVAIPIIAGGLLVALAELWEELHGKPMPGHQQATSCRRP